MKKPLVILFSFVLLFTSPIKAETVLYCQSELSAGFLKENNSWKVSEFRPARLTIKFNNDYSKVYESSYSSDFPMDCKVLYSFKPNQIHCTNSNGTGDAFIYNKNTKRFLFTSLSSGGYVFNPEDPDTENILAGTCAVF